MRADREGLDIPALPSVWAVRLLLVSDDPPDGAVSLDRLFTPQEVAAWLRQEGYAVHGVPEG